MPPQEPLNRLVAWSYPILFLAMLLYAWGVAQATTAPESTTVLFSGTYALGATTLAANLCALVQEHRQRALAPLCDAVGVAVGAATQGAVATTTFSAREWDCLKAAGRALAAAPQPVLVMVMAAVSLWGMRAVRRRR